MSQKSSLIIAERKSPAWYLGLSLIALAVLAAAFFAGYWLDASQRRALTIERNALATKLKELQEQYDVTSEQAVMLQRTQQVDQLAQQQLVEQVAQLETQMEEQLKELRFYRAIMAPEDEHEGLTINGFEILPTADERRFNYKLSLIQAKEHRRYLQGKVELALLGQKGERDLVINIADLGSFTGDQLAFKFRYFQNFSGSFMLPEDFSPTGVRIKATAGGKKSQQAELIYAWPTQETTNNAE